MNKTDLDTAIENCLTFIKTEQTKNGGFDSFTGRYDDSTLIRRQTTFFTSLILSCLTLSEHYPVSKKIINKGIRFLLTEKNQDLSWNYWQKKSVEYSDTPYPNDLDDTCAALTCLSFYRKRFFNGGNLAAITKLLTNAERQPGGPYSTWLIDVKKYPRWNDIDIVVNANTAFFLKQHHVSLPNIEALIEESLSTQHFVSKYYHDELSILYFISRVYKGRFTSTIEKLIAAKIGNDGSCGNPLSTALACSAHLLIGGQPQIVYSSIQYLISYCLKNSFDALPFYIEEHKSIPIYAGSGALTAAFCLEALLLYKRSEAEKSKQSTAAQADKLHKKIVETIENRVHIFSTEVKKYSSSIIEAMLRHDPGRQITLLSSFTCQSMKKKTFDENTLLQLGSANLFGWLGYKIYDDILDNEGDPLLLPLANICLRETSKIFGSFFTNDPMYFAKVMDNIEKANCWERQYCLIKNGKIEHTHLPSYKKYVVLADKSYAHALGPLYLFIRSGFIQTTKEFMHLEAFFKHYLIARQLNDDAHDWVKDLHRGFLNSVSVQVIKSYMKKHSVEETFLDPKEIDIMQQLFWYSIIVKVCDHIFSEIKKARMSLAKLQNLLNIDYFESLLQPVERAAIKALEEKKKAKAFIKSYGNALS